MSNMWTMTAAVTAVNTTGLSSTTMIRTTDIQRGWNLGLKLACKLNIFGAISLLSDEQHCKFSLYLKVFNDNFNLNLQPGMIDKALAKYLLAQKKNLSFSCYQHVFWTQFLRFEQKSKTENKIQGQKIIARFILNKFGGSPSGKKI